MRNAVVVIWRGNVRELPGMQLRDSSQQKCVNRACYHLLSGAAQGLHSQERDGRELVGIHDRGQGLTDPASLVSEKKECAWV